VPCALVLPPRIRFDNAARDNSGYERRARCDAAKITAIKRALAAKRGVRRIARDLKTGVGTVLRIKNELAA
jgi:hypothetical protein